jgi:hypothetical protein
MKANAMLYPELNQGIMVLILKKKCEIFNAQRNSQTLYHLNKLMTSYPNKLLPEIKLEHG